MHSTGEKFTITSQGIEFTVDIVMFDTDVTSRYWECAPEHKEGVTVQWCSPYDGKTYHYIPLSMPLAELTSFYVQDGHESPSAAAYRALQARLERDLSASEYGFTYTATVAEHVIVHGKTVRGYGFDWSYDDGPDLLEVGKDIFIDDALPECVDHVKAQVRSLLANVAALRAIAA